MGTNVYVDGFNLYYGCLKGSPYKWLDLSVLARALLPGEDVNRIRCFTAIVSARPGDPDQPQRQQVYLRALKTIPRPSVHMGHYLSHSTRMPLAHPLSGGPTTVEVIKTEEKGSDVNLATYLLLDAFERDCDAALVISNDSDLKEPISVAQSVLGLTVGIANPHPARRRSRALRPTFFKQIRESALRSSQFLPILQDEKGETRKPPS